MDAVVFGDGFGFFGVGAFVVWVIELVGEHVDDLMGGGEGGVGDFVEHLVDDDVGEASDGAGEVGLGRGGVLWGKQ